MKHRAIRLSNNFLNRYSMSIKLKTDTSKLGLMVLAGFVIFMLIIFFIGRKQNLFDSVIKLSTAFNNVSGLEVGNNIRFAGINVGTVSAITIVNDSTVKVDMTVKKDVRQFLRTDCVVSIASEGIIGDKILVINQGSEDAGEVEDGDMLPSTEPVETDDVLNSIAVTAQNLEIISTQLAEITVRINNGEGTLGRLIQDSVISENINQMIINLRKGSRGLKENMEAARQNFLLRGYFNKKEREARRDSIEKAEAEAEMNKEQ